MINIALKSGSRRAPTPDKSDYVIVNWRITSHPHAWRPPTDVYEHEDAFVVRVEIAGMVEDDFAIALDQNVLVVRGIRPDLNERPVYHQMEINFGEFITAVEIQSPIDSDKVRAEYQNGFLWVFLPKAQPKVIKIKETE